MVVGCALETVQLPKARSVVSTPVVTRQALVPILDDAPEVEVRQIVEHGLRDSVEVGSCRYHVRVDARSSAGGMLAESAALVADSISPATCAFGEVPLTTASYAHVTCELMPLDAKALHVQCTARTYGGDATTEFFRVGGDASKSRVQLLGRTEKSAPMDTFYEESSTRHVLRVVTRDVPGCSSGYGEVEWSVDPAESPVRASANHCLAEAPL